MKKKHETRWIDSEQVKKTRVYQFYRANDVLIGNTIILLCGYWMTKFLFANRFGAPTDKIGVVVGNVSGHGIGSALFMSIARTLLRVRSRQPETLSQIVENLVEGIKNFQSGYRSADDITLVVIKT